MLRLSNPKEVVDWIDPDEIEPDEELTVMLFVPEANEPVWPGYKRDGQFFWACGRLIEYPVVAYAEMLSGPAKNEVDEPLQQRVNR